MNVFHGFSTLEAAELYGENGFTGATELTENEPSRGGLYLQCPYITAVGVLPTPTIEQPSVYLRFSVSPGKTVSSRQTPMTHTTTIMRYIHRL
jgi:hypothetical protein